MKVLRFIKENLFFLIAVFFLAFIPLFPKIPLIDIDFTWVYIRIEDFLVLIASVVFLIFLALRKVTIKTPLTIPIFIFWTVGLISTIHAIIFLFPNLPGTHPNLAVLHYLRRIEYLSLFFIGFAAMKNKDVLKYIVAVISVTILIVSIYGFLQKGYFIGWDNRLPAFSTMNEEFAKGIPLKLSSYARITSTFAGHYDLAAYLVLLLPLMGSLIFGVKKYWMKFYFLAILFSGYIVLLLTSSRISFLVYILAICVMLAFQKQKKLIIPFVVVSIVISNYFTGITQRFQSTLTNADVIVDARTGKAVGIAKKVGDNYIIEDELSTGENLPQGSGYLGDLSGVANLNEITYIKSKIHDGEAVREEEQLEGDYYVKSVLAYDISFTTRFQGTWPRAWTAFNRSPILGSGYSSIDLASDGNYIRMLGETGVLGLIAYIFIFIIYGILVSRVLPLIKNNFERAFIIGISAGLVGLGINAVLIDVFEASKVAFVLWLIMGITVGLLVHYKKKEINYISDIKKLFMSAPALGVYLASIGTLVYSRMLKNFFVGDDFTWLRWAADCKKIVYSNGLTLCEPKIWAVKTYLLDAEGFFYRPGTKIFFLYFYPVFAFNPQFYHFGSMSLHLATTIVIYLLSRKLLKSDLFGFLAALMFMMLSIHTEIVFWVAATGHLISFFSIIFAVYLYVLYLENKNILYLLVSIASAFASVFFHEVGIITPVLIIAYDLILNPVTRKNLKGKLIYLVYLWIIPVYLYLRFNAHSHFMQGDYSYNLSNLPFNIVGNSISYFISIFCGTHAITLSHELRSYAINNLITASLLLFVVFAVLVATIYILRKKINSQDIRITLLSIVSFLIPLIIFLGLGNVSPRYVYLASFGVILFVIYLLQKFSDYLNKKLKNLGYVVAIILVFVFSFIQFREIVRINADWNKAGKISEGLVYGLNETLVQVRRYFDNPVFYFVNVPIKYGEAWVFPVGLEDAVWFNFQSDHLTVKLPTSLELAFDDAEGSRSAKIFEFGKDGVVSEVHRLTPEELKALNE